MRALVIPAADAEPVREVQFHDGNLLDQLQAIVGGDIEGVPFWVRDERDDVALYVNESGKLLGLPLNIRATRLVAGRLRPGDYITGHMVLTGFDPETGETVDLPNEVTAEWLVAA